MTIMTRCLERRYSGQAAQMVDRKKGPPRVSPYQDVSSGTAHSDPDDRMNAMSAAPVSLGRKRERARLSTQEGGEMKKRCKIPRTTK